VVPINRKAVLNSHPPHLHQLSLHPDEAASPMRERERESRNPNLIRLGHHPKAGQKILRHTHLLSHHPCSSPFNHLVASDVRHVARTRSAETDDTCRLLLCPTPVIESKPGAAWCASHHRHLALEIHQIRQPCWQSQQRGRVESGVWGGGGRQTFPIRLASVCFNWTMPFASTTVLTSLFFSPTTIKYKLNLTHT
jgi:hypothetical protein